MAEVRQVPEGGGEKGTLDDVTGGWFPTPTGTAGLENGAMTRILCKPCTVRLLNLPPEWICMVIACMYVIVSIKKAYNSMGGHVQDPVQGVHCMVLEPTLCRDILVIACM